MKIDFATVPCVPVELLHQNVEASRGYPYVSDAPRGPLAIVAGGQSILDHVDELKSWPGDVWACNSAYHWCVENGIDAVYFNADPSPEAYVHAVGAKRGILATTVSPFVFDEIESVEVFDLVCTSERLNHWTTTATAVPELAVLMGYSDITFFGCESSYADGTHAYKYEMDEYQMRVVCGGREFFTGPPFLMQAEYLSKVINVCPSVFKEKSGGLLKALMEDPIYDITGGSPLLAASLVYPEGTMVIYMKHAVHGTKVAISDEEAKADEKNGWERFTLQAEPVKAEPVSDEERTRLVAEYTARFGKAPHHKKSVETLRADLAKEAA